MNPTSSSATPTENPAITILERDIRVIAPAAWWSLAVVAVLVAGILTWSFFGQLPTLVAGQCMLMGSAGLSEIRAGAVGRLAEVTVRAGEMVHAGDVIATISQPDQDEHIKRLKARVSELESRAENVASLSSKGVTLNEQAFARRRQFLEKQIEVARSRVIIERNQVETLRQLADQRLATRGSVEDAERSRASAEVAVEALQAQIGELARERTDVTKRESDEKSQIRLEASEARRELALLESEHSRSTVVKSAFDGRVVEIKSGRGSLVSVDTPVAVLERVGKRADELEVVMYVASNDGKKIHPGARAEVLPATARVDEDGYLVGRVDYVSDYPATPQALLATLGSEELVKDLISVAAPFEVRIGLQSAGKGYTWTHGGLDAPKLQAGTLCSGNVIVRRERPIGFVIPALRKETR